MAGKLPRETVGNHSRQPGRQFLQSRRALSDGRPTYRESQTDLRRGTAASELIRSSDNTRDFIRDRYLVAGEAQHHERGRSPSHPGDFTGRKYFMSSSVAPPSFPPRKEDRALSLYQLLDPEVLA